MKNYLSVILYFTLVINTYSQSVCTKYIQTNYDRITGKSITAGKIPLIISTDGKTGFGIKTYLLSSAIVISMKVLGGSSCLEEDSPIYILFTDGSRLKLENQTKFNCDNEARIYFDKGFNNLNSLELLATKKIDALRISTMKHSVEEDFRLPQATILMNQLNCLRVAGGDKFEEDDSKEFKEQQFEPSPLDKIELKSEEKVTTDKENSPVKVPRIISLGVLNGKAIKFVDAPYPPAARAVHATGPVNVKVLIDVDGNVISVTTESGHPLLRQSAETAARQAKFSQTELSGELVQVSGILVFNFVYK